MFDHFLGLALERLRKVNRYLCFYLTHCLSLVCFDITRKHQKTFQREKKEKVTSVWKKTSDIDEKRQVT